MLIAFYKSHEDKECDCEIVKFVDRIWLEKSGDIQCIRTFIVHVKDISPHPLRYVRILTPFQQIPDLYDITTTCLDRDYLFNGFSTGGYEIKINNPEQHLGIISYDNFQDVKVYTNNKIKSFVSPEKTCRIISIEFPVFPIAPGEFRLFRCTFKITSPLDAVFPRVYDFNMNYFDRRTYSEEYSLLDVEHLEIPVNKLFNSSVKQGGFDVFLYLPPILSCTNFNDTTQTTSRHLPNGKQGEKTCQKFIWRARSMLPSEVTYLRAGETPLSMRGLLNDPFELEEIRTDISSLKSANRTHFRMAIIAIIFSLLSLLIALILSDSFRNWVIKLFTSGK